MNSSRPQSRGDSEDVRTPSEARSPECPKVFHRGPQQRMRVASKRVPVTTPDGETVIQRQGSYVSSDSDTEERPYSTKPHSNAQKQQQASSTVAHGGSSTSRRTAHRGESTSPNSSAVLGNRHAPAKTRKPLGKSSTSQGRGSVDAEGGSSAEAEDEPAAYNVSHKTKVSVEERLAKLKEQHDERLQDAHMENLRGTRVAKRPKVLVRTRFGHLKAIAPVGGAAASGAPAGEEQGETPVLAIANEPAPASQKTPVVKLDVPARQGEGRGKRGGTNSPPPVEGTPEKLMLDDEEDA